MTRYSVSLIVLLLIVSTALATPFEYAPEDNCTPDQWTSQYPYPRNALIGFDTDPATWTTDPTGAPHLDLQPPTDPSSYVLAGSDDPALYDSDWIEFGEAPSWSPDAATLGLPGSRTGIIYFNNLAGQSALEFAITWHLDNSETPNAYKNVWSELIWLQTGASTVFDVQVTTEPGHTVRDQWYLFPAGYEELPDGWLVNDGYARIEPNPTWEEVSLLVSVAPGELLALDSWHTATECVPEPGSLCLFGLGAIGLAAWRRRCKAG